MTNEDRALEIAERANAQAAQMLDQLKAFRAETATQVNWLWAGLVTCAGLSLLAMLAP